jgi:Uma2 family endonuclease
MSDTVRRKDEMTFEEAARLDPDTHAGEIDAGRWVPVTKSTWRHGEIMAAVTGVLRSYAREHPGWAVACGDPGTKLARDPDVLRGPDVGIVRSERKPTGRGAGGWLDGAPDVAVEILGDSQPVTELVRKALEYLAAGAGMVWLLEAEPRRVMVLTPPNQVRILGAHETLDGGDVLPGFSCRVEQLFE